MGQQLYTPVYWDEDKVTVMLDILYLKFNPVFNYDLARQLSATGNKVLIETNHWNDRFWGQCPEGVGYNVLGSLLMQVRGSINQ